MTWYANGFKKGYESGVNAPIKKEQCGYDDGVKFVEKVKKKFGKDIKYINSTRTIIENFEKTYLNDINNIPVKYRGMLYKRWYCDSFRRAVKNNLIPVIEPKNGETIEDADNVMKHILANPGLSYSFRIYATYDVNERLEDLKIHKIIDKLNPTLRCQEEVNGKARVREFLTMTAETVYQIFEAMAEISGTMDRLHLWKATAEEKAAEENAEEVLNLDVI